MRREQHGGMGKRSLVDDDPDFNVINRTILESDGYRVEEARDPESAGEKIRSWKRTSVKALLAAARPMLPRPADDKGIGLKK